MVRYRAVDIPKRFVVKMGDNVLNSSNEGEQLFYYNCFDNLKTKAFLSNILGGFVIICHCDEGSDHSVFPGQVQRVSVGGWLSAKVVILPPYCRSLKKFAFFSLIFIFS